MDHRSTRIIVDDHRESRVKNLVAPEGEHHRPLILFYGLIVLKSTYHRPLLHMV